MEKILFLDLKKVNQKIDHEIKAAIQEVLDSGWYIMGEKLRQFERSFTKDLIGNDKGFAIGCNSGTDAIILSLLAGDIKHEDEVITVSHTAIPTISAIVAVGATPVFIDIDPATWVMDVEKVRGAITDRTKAVICVHLYGNMVDVFALKTILKELGREDIVVIEDVAQAHGASLRGQQAGTIGDFGAFSFYPSKNIGALGDGGAVFVNSEENYDKLLMFRNYGQQDRYNALMPKGINSRLDEIQAAVLSVKLQYLHRWNKQKEALMQVYRDHLINLPLVFQKVTEGCIPGWHLCVVKFHEDINRDKIMQILSEQKLQTLIHYPRPTHLQKAFLQYYKGSLPNTEKLAEQILSLPFNYIMEEYDVNRICDIFKAIVKI